MKKALFCCLVFFASGWFFYSNEFCGTENYILSSTQNSNASDEESKPDIKNMAESIKKIVKRGVLKVGLYKEDRVGFFEEKNGKLQGIDIELAEKISKLLGVKIEFNREAATYDALVDLLALEKVDIVISTFSDTPSRFMYIDFSDPYLELRTGIMVNKQSLATDNIENNLVMHLKSTKDKICVQKGSSYSKIAKDLFPLASFVEVDEIHEGLELTKDAQVFGTFCSDIELIENIARTPVFSIYTKSFVFSDIKDRFCIGLSKNHPDFKNFINECLRYFRKVSAEDVEKKYKQAF